MRDSNVANAAKESAQAEFPHGLLEQCNTFGTSQWDVHGVAPGRGIWERAFQAAA